MLEPDTFDPAVFRSAMRHFAASVVVVTSQSDRVRNGLTATAVTSVSAEPPSILACVNKSSSATELMLKSGHFAINVLAADQIDVAQRFSTSKLSPDVRFADRAWTVLRTGAPVLEHSVASFDCAIAEQHSFGTHHIFIGHVLAATFSDRQSLLYRDGAYQFLANPRPDGALISANCPT